MKKMTPLLFVVLFLALAGVILVGSKIVKQSGKYVMPSQTTYPVPSGASGAASSLTLSVASPTDGSQVTSPTVTVKGKTMSNAEVFVNDTNGTADGDGNFSIATTLDEGENTVIVVANDSDGNVAEQELTVTYNSGT